MPAAVALRRRRSLRFASARARQRRWGACGRAPSGTGRQRPGEMMAVALPQNTCLSDGEPRARESDRGRSGVVRPRARPTPAAGSGRALRERRSFRLLLTSRRLAICARAPPAARSLTGTARMTVRRRRPRRSCSRCCCSRTTRRRRSSRGRSTSWTTPAHSFSVRRGHLRRRGRRRSSCT